MPRQEFFSLRQLTAYSGLSRNTIRKHLEAEPALALPSYRFDGKILVRRDEFDAWIGARRTVGSRKLLDNLRELGLGAL